MNKQELIEKYKEYEREACQRFLKALEQLDEPQKVKVPQEIADEIEYYKKNDGYGLFCAMDNCYDEHKDWFNSNEETFARAWLDGYEVEKEKRYYIRLKGVDENYNYLNFIKHLDGWVLDSIKIDKKFRTAHTRKELEEAGFGWVFDCPGIEIEEVE